MEAKKGLGRPDTQASLEGSLGYAVRDIICDWLASEQK